MRTDLWFVVFAGQPGDTPVEREVHSTQMAITLDSIALFRQVVPRGKVALCVSEGLRGSPLAGVVDLMSVDAEPFHFGRRLSALVERLKPAQVFYAGLGSTPFLSADMLTHLTTAITRETTVVANSLFSSDFVAWAPGEALLLAPPPATDNDLAWTLARHAGLRLHVLERSLATQFDVDTPTDVALLQRLAERTGEATRRTMERSALTLPALAAVERVLRDARATVLLGGRIGPHGWACLERAAGCQTRVVSEERGMRASGRDRQGRVHSLLGDLYGLLGPSAFFSTLAETADAALIDSRVLFTHLRLHTVAADRFYSDLLQAERVAEPQIKALTLAAREAPIPVALGGHGLVCGGLYALAEIIGGGHR